MEQPHGNLDNLQPPNESSSSIPTVIDLTRKGEDCFLGSTAPDALRMGKSPSWFPNSGTANSGLQFSETGSSDIALHSGDQIQPDNALSHTTVTLSYVSRSHVFTTHNSLSQHSPLYAVPPIGKFPVHPHCDTDNGLGESSYTLNQHYLGLAEEPINLATQTELLNTLPQARVNPENDGPAGLTREPIGFNGGAISCEKSLPEEEEHGLPLERGQSLENGELDCQSNSKACADSSSTTLIPVTDEDEERRGSEMLIIMSKKQDSVVISDSFADRDLCLIGRDYRSPLEDPVSPTATSLEDVDAIFTLPQASCSPSAENCYLETPEEAACDAVSTDRQSQPSSDVGDGTTGLDPKDQSKPRAHRRKAVLEPLIDLTDDVCVSDFSENEHDSVVPHVNGNTKVVLKERTLPIRSSRGTRLEAIVMNINSSRYNVSGCILANKKTSASQSTAHDSAFGVSKRNDTLSVRKRRGKVKSSISVKTAKRKAVKVKKSTLINVNTDSCKDSTSDSEHLNKTKKQHSSIPPKSPRTARSKREPVLPPHTSSPKSTRKPPPQSGSQFAVKNSNTEPELLAQPEASVEMNVSTCSSPTPQAKSPKYSPGKAQSKSPGSKGPPTAKVRAARTPKRRRKKHKQSQASTLFSPKEPEIRLRYINYKEDKRDVKLDSFSPFVRVKRHQASPSLCTVVNYPEEVKTQPKKRQSAQSHPGGFISAVVPSTSCLQLGRVSMHSQYRRALVCCLCGQSANAIDLGDLHGPYYPEGYRPSTKTPVGTSELKGEADEYSDSDSSSCSMRGGGGRKCAIPPTPWALKQGAQLKQKGLQGRCRWAGDGGSSPENKRARLDAASKDEEDWYSPPVLPLEPCEYWLHEDCAIWSAGVFLVKGRVYGLEEAAKMGLETMCSACHHPGATLGCFFKGCPNKYHYRCALESDCVLIEENFSMKCKKHKNKTFKAPPGSRWDDR
ncbi:unnamed protein product [Menidia menidia]|uniref:(Atlantic silverside) hypothetical protein n=1 Tax=Menidia menidia TaxID=238744 RepID=A0A8S4B8Q0_9TELE|nr:unnamed protein product [Menidia menidia]